MNTYLTSAQRWLKSKFICAPNDWLEACIEWINEENEGSSQSQQQVNELVFEQWLLSDLHELGTQCLPGELTEAKKYQLNGTFALQIDSVVDISQSCYSQLQKIKGTENANAAVSAETHKPWEPKPSRMLMLKITDGTCNVHGMEYRPIPCLNFKIKPGCKILLKGRMLCRNGMLMLKEENVSILGGEVDTLMESNTAENVLKMTLETNLSNADKQYRQEFEGGPTTNTKTEMKPTVQNYRSQGTSRNTGASVGIKPQVKLESFSQNNVDEFDEDLPIDAFLDDMVEFTDNQSRSSDIDLSSANRSSTNQPTNLSNTNKASRSHTKTDNTVQNKHIGSNMVNSKSSHNDLNKKQNTTNLIQNSSLNRQTSVNNISSRNTSSRTSVKQEDLSDVCFMDEDFDDDFEISVLSRSINNRGSSNNTKKRQLVSPVDNRNNNSSKKRPFLSSSNFDGEMQTVQHVQSVDDFEERSRKRPLFASPGGNTVKVEASSTKIKTDTGEIDIDLAVDINFGFDSPSDLDTSEIDTGLPSSQEVDLNYDPWTYLSVVKKYLPTQQLICFKVKAYISTLTGKLECPDGKRWCLPVKINDGTSSMDVDLSNKVLTDLIGFSAPESQVLRKLAKTDLRIKEKLTQGIKKCQQKLVELLCIMEIQISPQVARPEVTSLIDITTADISVLADRLKKSVNKCT